MAKKKATKKAAKKATKKAAKKTTKKAAPKKAKAAGAKTKRKPNAAFMAPLNPSALLAEIVGAKPIPRPQVAKKMWEYIHKHGLQDKVNRRMIHADDKLKPIFGGKKTVTMFELTKYASKHLTKIP
jgi:chromatin remodeling complex protein RSC6